MVAVAKRSDLKRSEFGRPNSMKFPEEGSSTDGHGHIETEKCSQTIDG